MGSRRRRLARPHRQPDRGGGGRGPATRPDAAAPSGRPASRGAKSRGLPTVSHGASTVMAGAKADGALRTGPPELWTDVWLALVAFTAERVEPENGHPTALRSRSRSARHGTRSPPGLRPRRSHERRHLSSVAAARRCRGAGFGRRRAAGSRPRRRRSRRPSRCPTPAHRAHHARAARARRCPAGCRALPARCTAPPARIPGLREAPRDSIPPRAARPRSRGVRREDAGGASKR